MATILEVQGVDKLKANLAKLESKFGKAVKDAMVKAGYMVQATAKKSILTVSQGPTVTRYHSSGTPYEHVQAAKGDPPNHDQGFLDENINVEVGPDDVMVGTSVPYGFDLEMKMNHAWLVPALEENRNKILEMFGVAVSKVTKEEVQE